MIIKKKGELFRYRLLTVGFGLFEEQVYNHHVAFDYKM